MADATRSLSEPGLGAAKAMTLASGAFTNGQPIPAKYTCDGHDGSPQLTMGGAPGGTKSLALIVDDPDAPGRAEPWVHWLVWNLPPNTTTLPEGADVAKLGARQGTTDFRRTGYGGPCPPPGRHRYFFRCYALDTRIDLADGARVHDLRRALQGHVLAWGELMGTYQRG